VLVGGLTAGASGQVLTILLCGLAVGILGFVDDWRTLGPGTKLLVEGAAGVALWLAGVRAGLFGVYALDLLLTVFWVVAVTNAMNLLDNMDGLLPGIAAIAGLSFFAIAAMRGDYLVASFALAVGGACLGFLRHNFPPARIFLGDAGSLLLGFLLAALGLKLDLVGEQGLLRAAIPVLALGVPLLDTLLVIVSRLWDGRAVYRGATDHASHRLVRLGLSGRSTALVLYGIQAGLSAVAVWLAGDSSHHTLVPVVVAGAVSLAALVFLLRLPQHDEQRQQVMHVQPDGSAAGVGQDDPGTSAAGIGLPTAEELLREGMAEAG
jgi:UDP-GlcNAc:undecaprenyl-phosphate GlcNAc-1-phosphate transferase